ncbi:MAG: glycosyltransferase [Saprospiraceae bacterium]|nr:glycosyltransferase [Saprospiraceae bacterium]
MKICFISPTLTPGGSERVITLLANHFKSRPGLEVHVLLMFKGEIFYSLDEGIVLHQPPYLRKKSNNLSLKLNTYLYLRNKLRTIKPNILISFGGRYNAFVLMTAAGLNIQTFISDRSRPGIRYGAIQDFLNPFVYRMAAGIIAQTKKAKELTFKSTGHQNIQIIGNPLPQYGYKPGRKQKVVLNVGRFISSKNQDMLIRFFAELRPPGWELWFLGDGEELDKCKKLAFDLNLDTYVKFWGNQKEVESFYHKSLIFAFTSSSEGFPNALGEAMSAGCACISFDINAGPSDLIDDEINGFLIPEGDEATYRKKLEFLLYNPSLLDQFALQSVEKIKQFDDAFISNKFFKFISH